MYSKHLKLPRRIDLKDAIYKKKRKKDRLCHKLQSYGHLQTMHSNVCLHADISSFACCEDVVFIFLCVRLSQFNI